MNQLTRLITNTIGFIRDFFMYLIPALPSSLLFIYFFINWVKPFIFDLKDFISPPILIIVFLILIYVLGRFLSLFSYYLFDFYELIFNWIPFKINKKKKNLGEKFKKYIDEKPIKDFGVNLNEDDREIYNQLKIFTSDPQIFQLYLERYNLMLGYDRTISAGFFVLVLFLLIFKLTSISIFFPILFLILSVLFYFDWLDGCIIYDTNSLIASIFIDNNPQRYNSDTTLKNDQENEGDE